RYWNEIWMIGDCQVMIVNRIEEEISVRRWTNNKPCEAAIALKRSKYLKKALAEGVITIEELRQHDIGREVILPELVKAMQGENVDYAVIDGFPIPMRKVKRIRQAWDENTEIILASDGYPRLFPTLRETEDYLKRCLVVDPLCIGRHKATKGWMVGNQSFDDRAYIRFK
ncbi:MAG: hypothetical protein HUJ99_02920, partial [Bacteroidaceae bacterium]|nr:hypothetical protein [Bacteroidaceae bacterium]